MSPTQQRTGSFTAATHIRTKEPGPETRLQALFYQIGTHLQETVNDGRTYTVEIKITTFITVEPWEAEIGEYVHRDHFAYPQSRDDQVLEDPDVHAEKRTFQPTRLGYQRIE